MFAQVIDQSDVGMGLGDSGSDGDNGEGEALVRYQSLEILQLA